MNQSNPRILIVDDDSQIRRAAAFALSGGDATCVEAGTAEQAWQALQRQPVALALLDIGLPDRSGMDLLQDVVSAYPQTAVVMLTSGGELATARRAISEGAYAYVCKPFSARDLRIQVASAMERRQLRLDNDAQRQNLVTIFEHIEESVITVDAQYRITHLNAAAAALLGVAARACVGRPLSAALPVPFGPVADVMVEVLDTAGGVYDHRLELSLNGGRAKVLMLSAAPLLGTEGARNGGVLVIRDVTDIESLQHQPRERQECGDMVGKSARMQEIFTLIRNVAETSATVLIQGESGTGKELVASALHAASPRAEAAFIKVNCAALTESLLESELFGHVKGAFTGAVKDRIGRFEAADHGTILLDEIGDMSLHMQARLLRVLQEGEFERIGDSRTIHVDVRVIAATNQNLEAKIAVGDFRRDLYYRLKVVRIDLPPLRDRREDIPLLARHYCEDLNRSLGKSTTGISEEALDALMQYAWPGNVRELRNALEWAAIVCHGTRLQRHHLPGEILESPSRAIPKPTPHLLDHAPGAERATVEAALLRTGWNVAKAARTLGISRATLYHRLALYDLCRPGD